MSKIGCQCSERGDPLPTFCEDDLFCPQCGGAVAVLSSRNLQPPADGGEPALWVYPSPARGRPGGPEFRFDLGLQSPDTPLGPPRRRRLDLNGERCEARVPPWFDRRLEIEADELDEGVLSCRLRPTSQLEEGGYSDLPPEGAAGTVRLEGSCGIRELRLWAYRSPEFRVEVIGPGVQAEPPGADLPESWGLGRAGRQELEIRITPLSCLIYLPRPQGPAGSWIEPEFPEGSNFRVEGRPALGAEATGGAGGVLGPSAPATLRVSFEVDRWGYDEPQVLRVALGAAIPTLPPFELVFVRKPQGDLAFEPGPELRLEGPLYYGERLSSASASPPGVIPWVTLRNRGDDALRVHPPQVRSLEGPGGGAWLSARVEDRSGRPLGDENLLLEAGRTARLSLEFDLAAVSEADWSDGRPLAAAVRFEHVEYDQYWELRVVVPALRRRPVLDGPLAIDFGNTNTFAAVADPSDPAGLRAVLGLPDPEHFPSALCLTDLSDPAAPGYLIGVEAAQRGAVEEQAPLLVGGLKRELAAAAPGREPPRHVFLWEGRPVSYAHDELIALFLDEVIRRCERELRRTVTRVGLSYPANYSPESRDQLDRILRSLEARRGGALRVEPLRTDEASAVALEFALGQRMHLEWVKPLLGEGGRSYLLASFDFGGGSIDLSLHRFEFSGASSRLIAYRSRPLGIGGDEFFGGDNVTVVVAELLAARLDAQLNPPGEPRKYEIPLAAPDASPLRAEPIALRNARRLWEAAEVLKRIACAGEPTDDDRRRGRLALEALGNTLRARGLTGAEDAMAAEPTLLATPRGGAIGEAIADDRLLVGLEEIYHHRVERDQYGSSGYTVEERIRRCVELLRGFCEQADGEGRDGPRFIILAGASCRVPLARTLLGAAFPKATVVEDRDNAKSKVAFGLIRHLDLARRAPDRVAGIGLACDYTHAAILWCDFGVDVDRFPWIPSCTPHAHRDWFPLPELRLADCWAGGGRRVVDVYRDAAPRPRPLGRFDLSAPGVPGEPDVAPELPADPSEAGAGTLLLRLDGDERRLVLRVRIGDRRFGDWPMLPPDPGNRG